MNASKIRYLIAGSIKIQSICACTFIVVKLSEHSEYNELSEYSEHSEHSELSEHSGLR